jgi:hypothetical protein
MASRSDGFAHRCNAGSVVDSICLKCYQTVARTTDPTDRQAQEAAHQCEGYDLAALLRPGEPGGGTKQSRHVDSPSTSQPSSEQPKP